MRNNVSEPLNRARAGRVLRERDMRSRLVIIDGVFRWDSPKVLRVERDHMISALAPHRPNQAFSIAVLPGRAERGGPTIATEDEVQALLERNQCPVPFHEVRTRFLGSIASPIMATSPMKVVQDLWGGALPEFETIEAANELIGALVMGLWNRLTRHQERSKPFRLTRLNVPATREGLALLALMRRQELDGFIEGLFAQEADISVPERASHGLDTLGEMRALMVSVLDMANDETKPAPASSIQTTLRRMKDMTLIAEREIHAVVLSCTRARRRMLATMPASKPIFH